MNNLNQITSRDYPGTNDVIGVALATNSVTVNGQTAFHKWEGLAKTNNTSQAQWVGVTVASGGTTANGILFFPKTPEQFSYDADGNLTNDGCWSYIWDGENHLVQMTVNTNIGPQYQLNFVYDYQGRRIQKIVSISSTPVSTNNFLYDGWNLVAETRPDNSLIRGYVWGTDLSGGMQDAGGIGGLLEIINYGSATNFITYDGNGNLVALVNAKDGTYSGNLEYGPFGEQIRLTGLAKTEPFRFSTKYNDDESDLLYYGLRYDKTLTGSWLSRDPIKDEQGLGLGEQLGGLNLYDFVANDPLNQVDNLGLAFYAIDGTWTDASDRANPWWLYNGTAERPRRYWRGPEHGISGVDWFDIAIKVYVQIQQDFCDAKASGHDLTINLTGWSRGSIIAAFLAKEMNDIGFVCNSCGGNTRYRPVKVNWIGLFDAVNMAGIQAPTSVPPNVAHFDHAVKTATYQKWFPTWHFAGANEHAFDNHNGTKTTHADIGMSLIRGNINEAYPWIKGQAVTAGVSF